ncbi:ABC-type polysaccharide/polyol phosphate transport system, ATPase component [Caballeronia arationis]|uniref:ABC-type polysaccharide/polyol phosphate transport system, ATPase component n=1 Tax=Caballeronia arationis TaxID=1777142 RepID=A0A7Z7N472_9BURK|nr:ABC transporter ATP-binding protein [Caballeronia arationis]SOE80817.1 ABC-type polysaccharide/polyol phosphate transport system, ATPase component [Caballeronia arationis]
MASELVIDVAGLTKGFNSYERPVDRLMQGMANLAGRVKGSRKPAEAGKDNVFWALDGVTFTVTKGETVGIIGRNGSGKSTLLQIVCQTLSPTGGTVEVNGRVAALLELGSGFEPEYTGRENVYLNAQLHGLTHRQVDERLADIIAFADIGEFIDQPVKTYSSGMFVRLAFAVIAHVDADILVVDEALAVGDAFFNQKCLRFMSKFRETGTILFVSHDTSTIKRFCSRVIWIDHGRIVREGPPDEVSEAYLQAYYDVPAKEPALAEPSSAAAREAAAPAALAADERMERINASVFRNDIEVMLFEPQAASFGRGDARIIAVELVDEEDVPLAWVVGGEAVTLRITAEIHEPIDAPIVGFFLNDPIGQPLFGDNTYLTYRGKRLTGGEGDVVVARFRFVMPILPEGDYSINAAIAEGTQENHVQLHWIHDALQLRSRASSVAHHLIGLPSLRASVSTQRSQTTS